MHDGISLEKLGRPTVVVVTEVFLHEAHVQRAALGMEGLQPLVIKHPLSTLTDEEIGQRVDTVVEQAPGIWSYG